MGQDRHPVFAVIPKCMKPPGVVSAWCMRPAEIMELLEMALDAGRYDIVFVENNEHAYSQIKRVQPNLVILCVRIEEMDGFQVLSMLKLDDETREIPVFTYTNEHEGQNTDGDVSDFSDGEIFVPKLALRMN